MGGQKRKYISLLVINTPGGLLQACMNLSEKPVMDSIESEALNDFVSMVKMQSWIPSDNSMLFNCSMTTLSSTPQLSSLSISSFCHHSGAGIIGAVRAGNRWAEPSRRRVTILVPTIRTVSVKHLPPLHSPAGSLTWLARDAVFILCTRHCFLIKTLSKIYNLCVATSETGIMNNEPDPQCYVKWPTLF